MKKQLLHLALPLTLCLTLLAGCGDAVSSSLESGGSSSAANTSSQATTASSEQTPVSSESASETQSAENEGSASSASESQEEQEADKTILSLLDDTKPAAYNEAIRAYHQFLSGETNAKDLESGEIVTARDTWNLDSNGELQYGGCCLFDCNNDGIPELNTSALSAYRVLSYQNGQVVQWYSINTGMEMFATLCENGAIFWKHTSTGTWFRYTTFGSNGERSETEFEDGFKIGYNGEWEPAYFFEGEEVSEAEYNRLTKEAMEWSEKEAEVEGLSLRYYAKLWQQRDKN